MEENKEQEMGEEQLAMGCIEQQVAGISVKIQKPDISKLVRIGHF